MFKQKTLFSKICFLRYFALLFLANSYICVNKGMEESVNDVSENETIELVDGSLSVKRNLLEKCSVIKDLLAVPGEGLELKTENYYTKKNFGLLLECLESYKTVHTVTPKHIISVINLAGNLGAPIKFRKKLTKRALGLNVPIVIDKEIGINTLETLLSSFKKSPDIIINGDGKKMTLFNKKLHGLQGIERLKSSAITEIDLSYNNLRYLDLSQLLKYFPNLTTLDVSCNKLEYLKVKELPEYFSLNASNNKLADLDIDQFIVGMGCKLYLHHNKFTQEKKHQILHMKKGFVKALYHHLLSQDLSFNFFCFGICAGIGSVLGHISGHSLSLIRDLLQAQAHDSSQFCKYGSYIGALAFMSVPIVGFYDKYKLNKLYSITL